VGLKVAQELGALLKCSQQGCTGLYRRFDLDRLDTQQQGTVMLRFYEIISLGRK
jgi:hypothetical protein